MLKRSLLALALLTIAPAAAEEDTHCYVHGVDGRFRDGSLIYEYTAPDEELRVFRATCRGGEVYVLLDMAGSEPIEFRVIEPEMASGNRNASDDDNRRLRFAAYAVPRARYVVYEYSGGSRAIIRYPSIGNSTTIGSSPPRRGPGGERLGERIGEWIPLPVRPSTPPPPPSESLLPVALDDPANWATTPFVQPSVDAQTFAGYHPQRAADRGMEGSVTLGVSVNAQGRVENVVLLSQTQPGWNFEMAAAAIARAATWPTTTPEGQSAPYRARSRFQFRLSD